MLLAADTKVLVVHRRLFENDQSRYFVGRVEGYEAGIAKIRGRTWTRDKYGQMVKKDDDRIKIVSLSSGTLIVYQLPSGTDMEALQIEIEEQKVVLKDGQKFEMDLSEVPAS